MKARKYELFARAKRPRPMRVREILAWPAEAQVVFDAGTTPPAPPRVDEGDLLDAYSNAVVRAVETVGPSVLRIHPMLDDANVQGVGSGFVVADGGIVLTNSHVVQGARRFVVITAEGRSLTARCIGDDPDTDLALLKIDQAIDLPVVRLGTPRRCGAASWRSPSARRWVSRPR